MNMYKVLGEYSFIVVFPLKLSVGINMLILNKYSVPISQPQREQNKIVLSWNKTLQNKVAFFTFIYLLLSTIYFNLSISIENMSPHTLTEEDKNLLNGISYKYYYD